LEAGLRTGRLVAAAAVLVLLLLHNDVWNSAPRTWALLGWLPLDIAYHVGWLVAGTLVLLLVLRVTWPRTR
jgi:hypothetical protein